MSKIKTKDEILKEAADHFGVKIFANDDGVTRRIEHYAMEEYANQKLDQFQSERVSDKEIEKLAKDNYPFYFGFNDLENAINSQKIQGFVEGAKAMQDKLYSQAPKTEEVITYDCEVCGQPFGDKLSLYEHYKGNHNKLPSTTPKTEENESSVKVSGNFGIDIAKGIDEGRLRIEPYYEGGKFVAASTVPNFNKGNFLTHDAVIKTKDGISFTERKTPFNPMPTKEQIESSIDFISSRVETKLDWEKPENEKPNIDWDFIKDSFYEYCTGVMDGTGVKKVDVMPLTVFNFFKRAIIEQLNKKS